MQSCLGRKLQLESREMIYMCRQLAEALAYIHAQVRMEHATATCLLCPRPMSAPFVHSLCPPPHLACSPLTLLTLQGLVHMDLAARNVLVGSDCLIKLADFGQSQRKDDSGVFILKQVMRMSVRWMAPETLAGLSKIFSERTDVW